ncbi:MULTISPECIES: FAD assembly factor SdhE [Shewanella]|uniref:FAD assembly factor SdhE n=1 Tax=Shewanella fidelis TaxID=173509 RepID=A0AAW8NNG9_9GAMM|nr:MULTISPECIES: succinate dehydrogenase assembly factor 2 [Shewanella]MDR8524789.1 succinate dehydrogenase assembly factor 2 [Shewanella fidelis]MDW4810860.1 succinate dehydrogenase assembly factor 2 [Shewanella fidelis]MDW4815361.1 succinate dehydrogenase assembly factor 2 [Shewanella fidelis]MDW4819451.1 succinate dehydrogenase assembly factor 2 [Shewanella fidelis]MDW4822871.1 succinate dehydrogenase assembly factor 2 [Shewanella fidelis]
MKLPRVKWACRRGMLELDVLFQPFVEEHYESMSLQDKLIFTRLLECEDPELFAWFMGHEVCQDPDFAEMIIRVRGRPAA